MPTWRSQQSFAVVVAADATVVAVAVADDDIDEVAVVDGDAVAANSVGDEVVAGVPRGVVTLSAQLAYGVHGVAMPYVQLACGDASVVVATS